MKHIAVIGAGMAGAGAARKLRQAGHRVTVFEREAFVGGRAYTYRGEGFNTNTGAGFFTNFYPHFSALVKELGLEDKIIENPKVVTLADGERSYDYHLDSIPSFFRIPYLTAGDKFKLIRLTISLMLKKKRLNLTDPHALAAFDKESISEFSRRKLGERTYQYLVRTAIEPYWYFSCEEASVAMMMALQAVASSARFFSLKGGIDQVAQRMLAEENLHLNASIERISSEESGKLRLEFGPKENMETGVENSLEKGIGKGVGTGPGKDVANGPEASLGTGLETGPDAQTFDGIIVAATASTANHLTRDCQIPIPVRSFLNSQSYAANLNAYFFLPEKYLESVPSQISGCGPHTDKLAAIARHGSEITTGKHPGLGILGIWLLDKPSQELLNASDEEVAAQMWSLARQYHPELPPNPTRLASINRRREAIPVHAPGRYRLASSVWKAQQGPIVFAGDYLTTATMEGALQSGYWASEILNKHLTP